MVTLLAPVVARTPTFVKVANFPGLYRHARSGRYYACKKLGGIRRERSLGTCDRKIAERRLKELIGSLDKVDAEVEKTTLSHCCVQGRGAGTHAGRRTAVEDCQDGRGSDRTAHPAGAKG